MGYLTKSIYRGVAFNLNCMLKRKGFDVPKDVRRVLSEIFDYDSITYNKGHGFTSEVVLSPYFNKGVARNDPSNDVLNETALIYYALRGLGLSRYSENLCMDDFKKLFSDTKFRENVLQQYKRFLPYLFGDDEKPDFECPRKLFLKLKRKKKTTKGIDPLESYQDDPLVKYLGIPPSSFGEAVFNIAAEKIVEDGKKGDLFSKAIADDWRRKIS